LRPFDTSEHRVFFGRTRETDHLVELLRSPAERVERSMFMIVGPSGCGKSSLVRAGLLPVMTEEPGWSTLPPIVPGAQPVAALSRELAASAHRFGIAGGIGEIRARLGRGELNGLVEELLHAEPGPRRTRLLLVIDQLEELLTRTGESERAQFVKLLEPALGSPVQVVATLRPEFLDQFLADPHLGAIASRVHTLRPLQSEALRRVIEGPAEVADLRVDDDLVARMVADTGAAVP
jgi:hypothetical protein